MEKEQEIIRTSLRLPKDLYDKLSAAAGGRTMHAEILSRLENSLDNYDSLSDVTEKAIETLERISEESKLEVAQFKYMLSQVKMMRYLLDQFASSDGSVPEELLDIVKILSENSEKKAEEFSLSRFIELFEEAYRAQEAVEELEAKSPDDK